MQYIENGGAGNSMFAKHISAHIGNVVNRFKKEGDAAPVSTGLEGVDRAIGGLYPGELVIAGGRPRMGKTGFSLAIAKGFAADSRPVLYFSLGIESGDHLTARLCNFLSMEEAAEQRTLADWQTWFVESQASLNEQLPIYFDESPSIDIDELCRRVHAQYEHVGRMGLVVVENLHLLCAAEGIAQSKWPSRLQEISAQLKRLAELLQITILANTSLKRKLERRSNKTPLLSDMQADFRLQGDLILLLYREKVYSSRWDDDRAILSVAWDKTRPISRGCGFLERNILLSFDAEQGMFTNN